ncbi:hypothetical protein [Caulobacter sp. S45]|uniref:hypothetical protein n=1 Tax=Caulobacter sp. S45 TaxID=1641861 RepID=UPI00157728A9|nr:hypothetical protein [Caulobacter sp. S45]
MADIRTSSAGHSLVPQARSTPARSEAVKAAQRAFFQAALDGVAPAAAVQPRITPAVKVQPTGSDTTPPSRLLRPGSLLDIKV